MRLAMRDLQGYIEDRSFDVYACDRCDTRRASPLESDERIYDAIYRNADALPGYWRYGHYAKEVLKLPEPLDFLASAEDVYWAVRQCLRQTSRVGRPLRVLEVGSGLGYLTHSISRAGYDIVGLEISSTAVARARERYGDLFVCASVEDYARHQGASFDVIIIAEVIEHLTDPISVLKHVVRLVAPQGRILVTTPNRSYFLGRRRWGSDLPPVHLWWFSERSMEAVADRLGMKLELLNFRGFNYTHPQDPLERWLSESYREGPVLNKDGSPNVAAMRGPPPRSWFATHVPWRIQTLWMAALGLLFNPTARRKTLAAVFHPARA
jgi:SAM-dependent methyltransferase